MCYRLRSYVHIFKVSSGELSLSCQTPHKHHSDNKNEKLNISTCFWVGGGALNVLNLVFHNKLVVSHLLFSQKEKLCACSHCARVRTQRSRSCWCGARCTDSGEHNLRAASAKQRPTSKLWTMTGHRTVRTALHISLHCTYNVFLLCLPTETMYC